MGTQQDLNKNTKMSGPYKGADSKREGFRNDLEKSGVLDYLTKVLVGLYEEPEKPNNALDFLKQHLGAGGPESADTEALKLEVTELKQENERLMEENMSSNKSWHNMSPQQKSRPRRTELCCHCHVCLLCVTVMVNACLYERSHMLGYIYAFYVIV